MYKDRTAICNIISQMLDNPEESGIYPTSTAYNRLEHYVNQQREEAIGWAHAWACVKLDKGLDPRTEDIAEMLSESAVDLAVE
jgi:hypothetical protein